MPNRRLISAKHIAVPNAGPRAVETIDRPTTTHPPQVIQNLAGYMNAIIRHSGLPDEPTEQDHQNFLGRYSGLLKLWLETNFDKLRAITAPHIQFPLPSEQYHRNLLWHEPDLCAIYMHVWARDGRTSPHTHGKQIGLIVPIDIGMQEEGWEMIGSPWMEGVDRFARLISSGSAQVLFPGKLYTLSRDTCYLHVVRNFNVAPCRVMEIYVRPQKKIRLFEPTDRPRVFREVLIRKSYEPHAAHDP